MPQLTFCRLHRPELQPSWAQDGFSAAQIECAGLSPDISSSSTAAP
jgi:hypothetical protein